MRIIKLILFLITGLLMTYLIVAGSISELFLEGYRMPLNGQRAEMGLQQMAGNWHLDSTELIGYGNYSISELEDIAPWRLWLEDEKFLCEYWSPKAQTNPSYYKRICYVQSRWFWKNRVLFEFDHYKRDLKGSKSAELAIKFDFSRNKIAAYLDSLDHQKEMVSLNEGAEKKGYWYCGTGLDDNNKLHSDYSIIDIERAHSILKDWKELSTWKEGE
ncbi:hypothetical protein [Croceimicrobium hydrocarbonivorans]|uniref:Uncharacterized protein n=1 Tax=Croceimicrobium hydrocarbonivorans TaxID=2761580 RepID=A0A7H0VDP6_9FLAO|nr:hypothetical protein [Croceimicrobium hydrocarbonivorans]QNR23844.1 hypothetical protein H4K34_15930 [Croceimicrobium hydrocarbonivorans]